MPRFIIEDDFWSLFPHAKIGTVICQGIDNSIKDVEFYEKLLQEAEKEAHKFLSLEEFSSNPVVFVWREAFQKFKTKKGNTSDGNVDWYNLMNVVTDQGEQIDGQMKDFFADDAKMDSKFIGKVKKEYQDGFIVKNDQINTVKLVFGYSMNADSYENITEQQTVEYSLQ